MTIFHFKNLRRYGVTIRMGVRPIKTEVIFE
nr:MAG TPA: hypothetical protein [Caudoviricetes sp.]